MSWLTGASIGVRDDTALAELHSTRMIVGNNLTILLELMAAAEPAPRARATVRGRRAVAAGIGKPPREPTTGSSHRTGCAER